MDDDVIQMFHSVNERFKRLEASLKAEVGERESLRGEYTTTDGEVDAILKSLGAWRSGSISKKLEEIDKRLDAIEKRLPKK